MAAVDLMFDQVWEYFSKLEKVMHFVFELGSDYPNERYIERARTSSINECMGIRNNTDTSRCLLSKLQF